MILLHHGQNNEFVHVAWLMFMCLKCLHGSHRQKRFFFLRLSAHMYISKLHYEQYTRADTALKYEYKSQLEKNQQFKSKNV